ncbi:MAG: TetR/AcrR family transcriptional regulator [Gammaproteobacteria bacterium SHHR-1]|uniref:TetR/AcrR family transcriptional regulator n=1 Tax=Magnetovirga frankeli TaxID=947516 RepID=UPI001293D0CD|nr:TetR/AcrR family transcriptional regulator [gamma proteobacterium SS-5]
MSKQVGRPLQFDPEQVLERAMQLFWLQGYEATSLHDLLAHTGISKSSLYQTFGGKQQLFRRCIGHYSDRFSQQMRQDLAAASSGRAFIEDFLHSALDETRNRCERRGCLVMNAACEFAQSDPVIAKDVRAAIERFRRVLKTAVERGQQEGGINPELDPQTTANYLVSSMSGLKTQSKAGASAAQLRGIIGMVLRGL